jgi:hypothetical protein
MTFKDGSQNDRLLKRLQEGPCSNAEMVRKLRIFRYSGRIYNIRQAGHKVETSPVPEKPGLVVYRLT